MFSNGRVLSTLHFLPFLSAKHSPNFTPISSAKHGDFVLFTCFFDPATRCGSILQQAWGLSVYTSPSSECTIFPLTGLQLSWGLAMCSAKLGLILINWSLYFFDPDTRCILHLLSGSETIMYTLHLAVHVSILTSFLTKSWMMII